MGGQVEGMDWKMETSSHLWIVSEIDLSGDVVDGTYPLEGKKINWSLQAHLYTRIITLRKYFYLLVFFLAFCLKGYTPKM